MGRGGGSSTRSAGRTGTRKGAGGVGASAAPESSPTPALAPAGGITRQQFESAFDRSEGARYNLVGLDEFRRNLGGTREQQDQMIRAAVMNDAFTLNSYEGRFGQLSDTQQRAALYVRLDPNGNFTNPLDGQTYRERFVSISRRQN